MKLKTPDPKELPRFLFYDEEKGGYFLDWRYKDRVGEKRKRKVLGFIAKAQALAIHARFYEDMVNKRLGMAMKPKYSFRDAADSFLAFSKTNKKSWKDDARIIKHLKEFFGNCALESLDLAQVEKYEAWRRQMSESNRSGKVLAVATMNREKSVLRALVRRTVLNLKMDRNPLFGLTLPDEKNARNRTLSLEEYRLLLMACASHIRPLVQLAYLTGMRKGEIVKLQWNQVDFRNRVILLRGEDTKTGESREVPLDDELVKLLEDQRVRGCPAVFSFKGKPVSYIRTAFTKACARAGIKDFRFHDLRHCAITRMRKAGAPQAVIMSISGHKTDATFRRYDRIDRTDRLDALQRVRKLDPVDIGDFLETLPKVEHDAA